MRVQPFAQSKAIAGCSRQILRPGLSGRHDVVSEYPRIAPGLKQNLHNMQDQHMECKMSVTVRRCSSLQSSGALLLYHSQAVNFEKERPPVEVPYAGKESTSLALTYGATQ